MGNEDFSFSHALDLLKQGKRVGRREWKNARFVFLVQGSEFAVSRAPLNEFFAEGTNVKYRPHIDMCGVDGSIGTWSPSIGTWSPSMVDLMNDDWYEVTES